MNSRKSVTPGAEPVFFNPIYLMRLANAYANPFYDSTKRADLKRGLFIERETYFARGTDERAQYKVAMAISRRLPFAQDENEKAQLKIKMAVHLSQAIAEHAKNNSKYSCCTAYTECKTEKYLKLLTQSLAIQAKGFTIHFTDKEEQIVMNLLVASKQIMLHFSRKTDAALESRDFLEDRQLKEWVESYKILMRFVGCIQKLVNQQTRSPEIFTAALVYSRFLERVNDAAKAHAAMAGTIPQFSCVDAKLYESSVAFGRAYNASINEKRQRFEELIASMTIPFAHLPEKRIEVERTEGQIVKVFGYSLFL
jgi:hypothetical protein